MAIHRTLAILSLAFTMGSGAAPNRVPGGACSDGAARACTCPAGNASTATCVGGQFAACACSSAAPSCGDQLCSAGESCTSCPEDCGACPGCSAAPSCTGALGVPTAPLHRYDLDVNAATT